MNPALPVMKTRVMSPCPPSLAVLRRVSLKTPRLPTPRFQCPGAFVSRAKHFPGRTDAAGARIGACAAPRAGLLRRQTRTRGARSQRPAESIAMTQMNNLAPIPELYVSYDSAQKLKQEAADLISHDLSPR